ncbi:MAG: hypothetical protein EOP09_10055 [Proteobacteria bacterium]|nr:MAG: hypothetical protein EOP09_10055 [Pseudomonadota bacterium]
MTAKGACSDANDYCYVHINSTIPSHAAFLVSEAIGPEKAEQLYYFVLTHLMHPDEDFKSMADDMMEGCKQLGFSESDTAAVERAYRETGMLAS